MRIRHGNIGEQQRDGVSLPAALKDDLAALLAECLVSELREDNVARGQNVEKPTVESPSGTDRGMRNLAKNQG